jgi:glycerol-3-phosphate responsive antiterminator
MNVPNGCKTFITNGKKTIVQIIFESGVVKTKNEARRLIKAGAVKWEATNDKT